MNRVTMIQAAMALIIVAFVIAISVPLLVHNVNSEKKKKVEIPLPNVQVQEPFITPEASAGNAQAISDIENRMNARLTALEQTVQQIKPSNSGKYVCSLEGIVDEHGNITPMKGNIPPSQSVVLVCQR